MAKKGLFITFEGSEGCGKTTHSKLVYDSLVSEGIDCVFTREPGGTKLGEGIRALLLHSDDVGISDASELFLFEAARAQVIEEVIRPALEEGRIVLCDRFYDATLAYQGYGAGLPIKMIKTLNKMVSGKIVPDLTILFDIDTETGLDRASSKGIDRMEKKDISYHKRVRMGYLKLAKDQPRRFKVIKVNATIEETQGKVLKEIGDVIQRYKRSRQRDSVS
jgi:dTMP kinase